MWCNNLYEVFCINEKNPSLLAPACKSSPLVSSSVLCMAANSALVMAVTPADAFQNSSLQHFTQGPP